MDNYADFLCSLCTTFSDGLRCITKALFIHPPFSYHFYGVDRMKILPVDNRFPTLKSYKDNYMYMIKSCDSVRFIVVLLGYTEALDLKSLKCFSLLTYLYK